MSFKFLRAKVRASSLFPLTRLLRPQQSKLGAISLYPRRRTSPLVDSDISGVTYRPMQPGKRRICCPGFSLDLSLAVSLILKDRFGSIGKTGVDFLFFRLRVNMARKNCKKSASPGWRLKRYKSWLRQDPFLTRYFAWAAANMFCNGKDKEQVLSHWPQCRQAENRGSSSPLVRLPSKKAFRREILARGPKASSPLEFTRGQAIWHKPHS